MRMVALAFEVEHGVDDVLEGLGTGEAAVLRDVTDEERRDVVPLGGEEKLRRRLADLADAAGRRLELQREHGLHRVDDEQPRPHAADLFEDALDAGLGEQVERRVADAESIAARLDLMLGFFAGGVQHGADVTREVGGGLQQQRRLADPGSPPSSTSEPGTMPPPSTRSNSPMPLEMRSACEASISEYRRAPCAALPGSAYRCPCGRPAGDSSTRSSTSEFHAPQSVQRPCHFGDCVPHSWQTKTGLAWLHLRSRSMENDCTAQRKRGFRGFRGWHADDAA